VTRAVNSNATTQITKAPEILNSVFMFASGRGPKIILLGFIRRSVKSDRPILPPHTPYRLPGSNIHPLAAVNREWNKAQPPGTQPLKETILRSKQTDALRQSSLAPTTSIRLT
jgi:hypothetical protein